MKKLYILLILSIIWIDGWSQPKSRTQCRFGLKLGLGSHTVTGARVKSPPRYAFMGGMWLQIKMSKSWTMQSELTYIIKGAGGTYNPDHPQYGDYWLNLTYVEIPILFQYNKKKVYFEFGPGIAALIKAGETIFGGPLPYQPELYPFSKRDFTFNLGTGYAFNEKWSAGLRLTHSLIPVRKQLPEASHPGYNRGIVFTVSRQINFNASGTRHSQDTE